MGQKLTDTDHLNATFVSDVRPLENDNYMITNSTTNLNRNQPKRTPKGLHDSMITYYLLKADPDGDVTVQVHPAIVTQLTTINNNNNNSIITKTSEDAARGQINDSAAATVRGSYVTSATGEKMVFSKDSGM